MKYSRKLPSHKTFDRMIEDFHTRRQFGMLKYQKEVSTFDGEKYVRHSIEEKLDDLVYMYVVEEEHKQLKDALYAALDVLQAYANGLRDGGEAAQTFFFETFEDVADEVDKSSPV